MVKFKRWAIALTMMCFSAMMAAGCTSTKTTSNTAQSVKQDQTASIKTKYLIIKQYIGMKVDCPKKAAISDKDVENAIPEYLAENNLFKEDTSSKIKYGDEVEIGFVGKIDGKEFKDGSADNYDVVIDSVSDTENEELQDESMEFSDPLNSDFGRQLVGHKAGDKIQIKVTFPEDYEKKAFAGKEAVFETTVHYIKKPIEIPDKITDSFIKQVGYKSVADYKKYVKKSLVKDAEKAFQTNKEDTVTDALIKNTEIKTYPEDRLKSEMESVNDEYKKYAESEGVSFEKYVKEIGYDNVADYNKDITAYAKSSLKYYMACEAIADKEGIVVTDDKYKEKAKALPDIYGYENLSEMEKDLGKEKIKTILLDREVIDFVIKNADFTYTEENNEQMIEPEEMESTK